MGIFALDHRLGARRVLGPVDHLFDVVIHGRIDVDIVVRLVAPVERTPTEIGDQPRAVAPPDRRRRLLEIGANPRLVAQRPEDDRGVVLVPLDHVHHAGDVRALPGGVEADLVFVALAAVAVALLHIGVALDIGFVHQVEAVLVGQRQEARVVGIVRGADGVEVVALHQLQIAAHRLFGDDVEGHRVMLVPVDAADHDAAAIDHDLPVLDLDGAEADPLRRGLHHLAVRIDQFDQQRVEVGRLRRPAAHTRHRRLQHGRGRALRQRHVARHHRPLAVEQRHPRGHRLGQGGQRQLGRQRAVAIILVEPRMDEQIVDPRLGYGA